jgi:hypothetical protein
MGEKVLIMEKEHDPGPFFKEVRQRHHITLNMIIEEMVEAGVDKQIELNLDSLQLFDQLNIGRAEVVDAMIAALDRLSGEHYTRDDVGYIAFLASDAQDEGE